MNDLPRRNDYRNGRWAETPSACDLPAMRRTIADFAGSDDAEEQVADFGRQRFRANTVPGWGAASRRACEDKLETTRRRIDRRERQLLQTPETRIVMRRGTVPASHVYPVMGWSMLVLALVMLTPVPLVVAIGVAEGGMTLYALMERPWLALFYGFAPWGAVAALKLLRHALGSEAHRSWLDTAFALATCAIFAAWVHTYATTFLADISAGPGAAFGASASLGSFYKIQLLLEVAAGYSAWTLAERLLSHGMFHDVVPSAGHRALLEAQERDLAVEEAQAARLDAIEDARARHEAAEAEFVRTSLGGLADYRTRLKALSEKSLADARTELRADFTDELQVTTMEVPHDA